MNKAANEPSNGVVKLDDRSLHGEVLKTMMDDLNAAVEKGEVRALMFMYMDTDGCWNFRRSILPSCTRAVGALEQMKYNLMAE